MTGQHPEPVVLVTGGAKRIGAALSRAFHAAGYRVLIHCLHSREPAERLSQALNARRHQSAAVIQMDLAETSRLDAFIGDATATFGRLDVLVNNASVYYPTPFNKLTTDEINDMMSVNLTAPLLLCRYAAPRLTNCIVNITDVHTVRPLHGYAAYTASKAALAMVTRSLALELAPRLRVNAIAPGAILWPEDAAEMDETEKARLLAGVPAGRPGDPADIAAAAVFLADRGTYITGETISVAGGYNAN